MAIPKYDAVKLPWLNSRTILSANFCGIQVSTPRNVLLYSLRSMSVPGISHQEPACMQHRGRGRECVQVGFVGGVQV